eukprot:TRINITY_DN32540_c0_g1_i1.p2 TRINITY_DN32540_c0_g1~~TRINITY_DN32540_c0_g1_i1.p2  ORF type:complete len:152 (+),score=29.73 TRINITY_DN32540_c0_g1_i1:87-542(+)
MLPLLRAIGLFQTFALLLLVQGGSADAPNALTEPAPTLEEASRPAARGEPLPVQRIPSLRGAAMSVAAWFEEATAVSSERRLKGAGGTATSGGTNSEDLYSDDETVTAAPTQEPPPKSFGVNLLIASVAFFCCLITTIEIVHRIFYLHRKD